MIKVSVLYPNFPGATFDMSYYVNKHMPMVRDRCAPACRGIAAEGGVAGGAPGAPPPYIAVGHLTFDSVAAFQAAFVPHVAEIMGDIPNYTNATPVVQISEVTL
jgi:uncharacterized protein (TIGR02118 family)